MNIKKFEEFNPTHQFYNRILSKVDNKVADVIRNKFTDCRVRFLEYILRGETFENSISSAAFDTIQGIEINDDVLRFLQVVMVFDNYEDIDEMIH